MRKFMLAAAACLTPAFAQAQGPCTADQEQRLRDFLQSDCNGTFGKDVSHEVVGLVVNKPDGQCSPRFVACRTGDGGAKIKYISPEEEVNYSNTLRDRLSLGEDGRQSEPEIE